MIKKEITYKNFDDEVVVETARFGFNETELMELEAQPGGGLTAAIKKIEENPEDGGIILGEIKKIIMWAYGVVSEDGRRFIKNDMVRKDFEETGAYNALVMSLATNADAAAAFMNGLIPSGLVEKVEASTTEAPRATTILRSVARTMGYVSLNRAIRAGAIIIEDETGESTTVIPAGVISRKDALTMSRDEVGEALRLGWRFQTVEEELA